MSSFRKIVAGLIVGMGTIFGTATAQAELIDQGTTTLDTETNLEWLDLTETAGHSYDEVASGFGDFTTTGGFRIATVDEVKTLFSHAGFAAFFTLNVPADADAALLLLDLIGCTTGPAACDPAQAFFDRPFSMGMADRFPFSATLAEKLTYRANGVTIPGDFSSGAASGDNFSSCCAVKSETPDSFMGVYLIRNANEKPTANAGDDQSIRPGDTVDLDGSASFDDNTATQDLTYAWSFLSIPGGSTATLLDADMVDPSFVADVAGTYMVRLVVTDEGGLSSTSDDVEIGSDNLAPTADAGNDQLAIIFNHAYLLGFGSDPEGDDLTYAWTITGAPLGSISTLDNDTIVDPFFVPDLEGIYEVTLVVSDFLGEGPPDTVVVTATAAEEFAEIQIVFASDIIAFIPPENITTEGNRTAINNFLMQTMTAILGDDLATAIDKIEKAIIRTDGCMLNEDGMPDENGPGRDWITDCDLQIEVYNLLMDAHDALTQ